MTHVSIVKTFILHLTVKRAERLKTLGLFDVMALPIELQQLYELRRNASRFIHVVYYMLDNVPANLELADFSDLITNEEAFSQLWEAFNEEVTNFFPAAIRQAIQAVFQMLEMAESERIADLTATIRHSQSQLAANSHGDSFGVPPESPEPDPGYWTLPSDRSTTWPTESDAKNGIDMLDSALSSPTATDPSGNPLIAQTTSTHTEIPPAN